MTLGVFLSQHTICADLHIYPRLFATVTEQQQSISSQYLWAVFSLATCFYQKHIITWKWRNTRILGKKLSGNLTSAWLMTGVKTIHFLNQLLFSLKGFNIDTSEAWDRALHLHLCTREAVPYAWYGSCSVALFCWSSTQQFPSSLFL